MPIPLREHQRRARLPGRSRSEPVVLDLLTDSRWRYVNLLPGCGCTVSETEEWSARAGAISPARAVKVIDADMGCLERGHVRGAAAINGWGQLLLVHTPLRQISSKWSLEGAGRERQLALRWIETDVSLSGERPKR